MEKHLNIEIVGPVDFIVQVKAGLDLLKEKAVKEFDVVSLYIGRIEQAPPPPTAQSGMAAYESPPTYYLGRKTAFYSLTWCAGCIAHDAYHSKLYHEYLKSFPDKPVPDSIWSGTLVELDCNKFQLGVCLKISAPEHEIKHLKSLDGTHWKQKKIDW